MSKHPITPSGYQKLKQDIQHILAVERPKNIQEIETALSYGDLKENAEYHAAKEVQGLLDARLKALNALFSGAEVIDPAKQRMDKIAFGATVVYQDVNSEKKFKWQIVGEAEANRAENKISYRSPIARALLGKQEGDEVVIQIPKGKIEIVVESVNYL